jgi:hypothetical protein
MIKSLVINYEQFSYFHVVTSHDIRFHFQAKCTPRDKLKVRLPGQILDNTRVHKSWMLGHRGDYSVYGGA